MRISNSLRRSSPVLRLGISAMDYSRRGHQHPHDSLARGAAFSSMRPCVGRLAPLARVEGTEKRRRCVAISVDRGFRSSQVWWEQSCAVVNRQDDHVVTRVPIDDAVAVDKDLTKLRPSRLRNERPDNGKSARRSTASKARAAKIWAMCGASRAR